MPTNQIEISQPILGERRLARMQLDTFLLIQMMQEGYKINAKTIRGLPQGAVFIASYYDQNTHITSFVFYHPSFDEVMIGCELPVIQWEMQNAY